MAKEVVKMHVVQAVCSECFLETETLEQVACVRFMEELMDWPHYSETELCLKHLKQAVALLEQREAIKDNRMIMPASVIKDRILAAIDRNGVSYRSAWSIADELGIGRLALQGHQTPTNEYEQALHDLVADGVLEELHDLTYRYRRVRGDTTPCP